ncbi:hypothetical protein IFM89_035806 [Coptis chinensis]|uniref:Protein kinase domain-containing protein n=1 Tax=Coptis chinensis TaxID=261450 RepID=A0A835I5V5_9MAGN|nr:hypothetical protein IFM89_035806 [Coptis chinensis]
MRRRPAKQQCWRYCRKSLVFGLNTLRAATNNFSDSLKLGEGVFGSVYKAKIFDGKQVKVKRLSTTSGFCESGENRSRRA